MFPKKHEEGIDARLRFRTGWMPSCCCSWVAGSSVQFMEVIYREHMLWRPQCCHCSSLKPRYEWKVHLCVPVTVEQSKQSVWIHHRWYRSLKASDCLFPLTDSRQNEDNSSVSQDEQSKVRNVSYLVADGGEIQTPPLADSQQQPGPASPCESRLQTFRLVSAASPCSPKAPELGNTLSAQSAPPERRSFAIKLILSNMKLPSSQRQQNGENICWQKTE